ncbi:E3 SUMO-protein ligase ZBED1-like [Erpetoichthys calabaricus]|uniref:Zinc finger BED domain-containing protein 1-like n=1 Tax=Erpetoichthys calabaricus TaxID=27687 RepID=A0A8C4SDS8_ERPCA|nr:E3 SUMO-protein ligase ZBED1-like [Erpetoichthys calabaricus]
MATSAQMFAGRKRESNVWKYFNYSADNNKSKCGVREETKECGFLVSGKNTTNLRAHLARHHPATLSALDEENRTKAEKRARDDSPGPKAVCQTPETCVTRAATQWLPDSVQHRRQLVALENMIIETGCPLGFVDQPAFRSLVSCLDSKFKMPGSAKLHKLLVDKWQRSVQHLKALLASARRVTVCFGVWSKPNCTSSFLGMSACFFDPGCHCSRHVVLQVVALPHPHTGDHLADAIEKCLREWDIVKEKVLMIVSDNGSNVTRAVRLMSERVRDDEDIMDETDTEDDLDQQDEGMESETEEASLLPEALPYRRMRCVAHTLHSVVKVAYKFYDGIIIKARQLVGRVRKSGVAMEKLQNAAGKVPIWDNATRWRSTYAMIKRLLELRPLLKDVLDEMQMDSLLVADWTRLEELAHLLEPFCCQTDLLQTDAMSLSLAFPSILDLQCHLQSSPAAKTVTRAMLSSMHERFQAVLDPKADDFCALPAASCLLDPTVAVALLSPEMSAVRSAAKDYVVSEVLRHSASSSADNHDAVTESITPALRRFPFLSTKLAQASSRSPALGVSVQDQLDQYLVEVQHFPGTLTALQYWQQKSPTYSLLAPVAEDLVCAPASQAFIERLFSLCGYLCDGRRCNMNRSLEMRACLKLNSDVLAQTGFLG